MHWRINVTAADAQACREYRLAQPSVRVGRAHEVEIRVPGAGVSRLHFTLARAGDRVRVFDSSRNGTYVREGECWSRVQGATELDLPAMVRAGDCTFDVAAEETVVVERDSGDDAVLPGAVTARDLADALAQWEQSVMLRPDDMPMLREAIMVFDLCESSAIASADDRMAYHLKQRLAQIAEPVLESFGRRFYKSTGDGFLATFGEPAAALDAAVALEQRLQQRNRRTRNEAIHYRVALHFGDVWAIDTAGADADIHGNDVNIAFRIEGVQAEAFATTAPSLPRRDRILCSRDFLAQVAGARLQAVLSGHVQCGAARLKGIAEPVVVHWLRTPYAGV